MKQLVQNAWSRQALITFHLFIKLWIINNNSNMASGQVQQLRTYQIGFLRLPGVGVHRIIMASDLGLAAS